MNLINGRTNVPRPRALGTRLLPFPEHLLFRVVWERDWYGKGSLCVCGHPRVYQSTSLQSIKPVESPAVF